jgi:hypothetical protein
MTLFKDAIELSKATCFFYRAPFSDGPVTFLMTNWHVLTGRDAADPTRTLDKTGAVPNKFQIRYFAKEQPGGRDLPTRIHNFDLFTPDGGACWWQHPKKNDVDIVVINMVHHLDNAYIIPVNETADAYDMKIEVGNDVLILGYPLGYEHFAFTPVWKKGIIAAEPNFDINQDRTKTGKVLIDATTREGMSGSPVVMRCKTHYVSEAGKIVERVNATRFLGVYAQRPIIEGETAELGYFYRGGFIHEILESQLVGPRYGELP